MEIYSYYSVLNGFIVYTIDNIILYVLSFLYIKIALNSLKSFNFPVRIRSPTKLMRLIVYIIDVKIRGSPGLLGSPRVVSF